MKQPTKGKGKKKTTQKKVKDYTKAKADTSSTSYTKRASSSLNSRTAVQGNPSGKYSSGSGTTADGKAWKGYTTKNGKIVKKTKGR